MKDKLSMVAATLRDLFADKSELVGFDDWDRFVGCIIMLESIANSLDDSQEGRVVNDG